LKYKDELILKLKVLFAGSVIVTVNSFNLTSFTKLAFVLLFSNSALELVVMSVVGIGTAVPTGNVLGILK
jgi:hypothetical protein